MESAACSYLASRVDSDMGIKGTPLANLASLTDVCIWVNGAAFAQGYPLGNVGKRSNVAVLGELYGGVDKGFTSYALVAWSYLFCCQLHQLS